MAMGDFLSVFATTPQRTSPMRGFQVLSHKDRPRLEAFFLAFDFDQRHEYFGTSVSDEQIRDYCRAIRWNETTIIARSCGACLEAVAILTATAGQRIAELSMACASTCDRQPMVADLLDLALAAASLSYSQVIIGSERAMPELLAQLHPSPFAIFDVDVVRVEVPCYSAKIVAC
jgi:hypothetical protein